VSDRRATALFLLVALGVFGGLVASSRAKKSPPPVARPSWQVVVDTLPERQRAFHDQLRARIPELEAARSRDKAWPESPGFTRTQQANVVNYVGEGAGQRWLLLVLEPDPRVGPEPAPPDDDEHDTLGDGTLLHVTLWTQPVSEPAPEHVTAFPAAEGWKQVVW
jgi:hypothetical protein